MGYRPRGIPQPPEIPRQEPVGPNATPALARWRVVDFAEAGGPRDCPVYARARLAAGNRLRGPAVVEQFDSTTLLLPDQEALVDKLGVLVVTEPGGSA